VIAARPSLLWRALSALVALLPWSWLGAPAAVLGWFVGSILKVRRAHAVAAIQRAGLEHARTVAGDVYRSLAHVVFETLWVAGRPDHSLQTLIEPAPGAEPLLRQCANHGRGLIVASAHTGNWDLLACGMAATVKVHVVTRHMSWTAADRFWQQSRERRGVTAVEAPDVMRSTGRELARGGVVAFMLDQAPERGRGVAEVSFLGERAWVDLAFALAAARHHVPIALVLDERLADGRHRMHMPLVLHPPERASRAWASEAAIRTTEALEHFVREHPGQWLWLHRRWKPLPPEAQAPRSVRKQ